MASRSVVTAKVLQYQTKALSTSTEGAWTVRFENMIADALKLGPLRYMEPELPAELAARLEQIRPEGLPSGNTNFVRKYLNPPAEVIKRCNSFGVSRYRVREKYLPK